MAAARGFMRMVSATRGDCDQSYNGELWASVNERDGLGDDLVPDYITHVQPGGF